MKKLSILKGVKTLNKKEQKAINGGGPGCILDSDCGCFRCTCKSGAYWL